MVAAGAWSGEVGRLVGIGKGTGIMGVPIPVEPRFVESKKLKPITIIQGGAYIGLSTHRFHVLVIAEQHF